jgi:hypothetical protein
MYHVYMQESRPLLVTTERKTLLPLLIIDKAGILGPALAEKLQEQFLVVLVTPTIDETLAVKRNIIHVPYRKKVPLIPDNIYSHVFIFYNGEDELLDMLPSFMRKTQESAGKLFFITPLFYSTQLLFKRLGHHSYHHMNILVYGEIFDNDLQEENLVNFFILQARMNGRIEVPNAGMGKLYPVHLEDVLTAIIATAFAQMRTNRILFAFPKHEVNELSVARMIQKINPDMKVDFRKAKRRAPAYYISEDGAYCFPDYNIEARLHDIDFAQHVPRSERVQFKKTLHRKKKRSVSTPFIIIILLLYFVILPVLLTAGFALAGMGALQFALKEAEAAHLESAQKYISAAHFSFNSAATLADSLIYLDVLAPSQKSDLEQKLNVGTETTEIARDILNAVTTIQNISSGKSTQPKQDFLEALATTKNSLLTLQKLKAEHMLPPQIEAKMAKIEDVVTLLENTGDTYPTVLGFEGKKVYLVLFQNNMELRPGGGFIGSYGLLSIENGRADKLQVYDVYDADGKLTEHVEPPYGLRRYLGTAHWFMRDSNFNPDFTRNALEASKFLQLETGQKVDGVIAIDTTFLQKVLKAFGSITVDEYKETVTPDNFYLLTQSHAEKNFFPGSSQKKDFLRALLNTMLGHIDEKKQISYPLLASAVIESMKGKHLLFSFSDSGVEEAFTVNNLSGALWDARSPSDTTFLDYLAIIDANIGTNKVNYYLKRSIQQNSSFSKNGGLQSTITITYENTSKKDSPFGGDYKNYIRFLLPKNANLNSVAFDNHAVQTTPAITDPAFFTKPGFVPPKALEIEQTDVNGKRAIGFIYIVPAGTKKTLALTYTIPQAINVNKPAFTYRLRVFKQPGTADDPYSMLLTYPEQYAFIPKKESSGADVGGKVSFQTILSEDKDLDLEFTKK